MLFAIAAPGSHRQGNLPSLEPYDMLPGQVDVTPQANTCIFLHTRTFHWVEKNATDAPRIQFNRRVVPENVPADRTGKTRFRNGSWDLKTGKPW